MPALASTKRSAPEISPDALRELIDKKRAQEFSGKLQEDFHDHRSGIMALIAQTGKKGICRWLPASIQRAFAS